jgi:hypothetical protein
MRDGPFGCAPKTASRLLRNHRPGCKFRVTHQLEETAMPMRRIASMTAAILLAATGLADARPDTRTMSCDQLQQLIQSHRAVVRTTGPNTYDRYVRQFGNECDWPEVPMSAYVPTRDGSCPVYRCEEPVNNFPN